MPAMFPARAISMRRPDQQVAAVETLVEGNKAASLVMYCNGPYCQASRRLGEQLAAVGFTNVRRYQLGIPVWRALGGPTVVATGRRSSASSTWTSTAVYLDARTSDEFAKGQPRGRAQRAGGRCDLRRAEEDSAARGRLQPPHRVVRQRRHAGAQAGGPAQHSGRGTTWVTFQGSFDALATTLKGK